MDALVIEAVGGVQFVRFSRDWLRLVATDGRELPIEPLLTRPEVLAVLDGSMFHTSGERLIFGYYDRAAGLEHRSERPRDGVSIAVGVNGALRAEHGGRRDLADAVAVQLYPSLLERGRVVVSGGSDTETDWRAALGILRDGSLGLAVGQSSMLAFARGLAGAGFVWAGYTDGGSSTRLMARVVTQPGSQAVSWRRIGPRGSRGVPGWILVERPRIGVGAIAAAGIVVAAAVGEAVLV